MHIESISIQDDQLCASSFDEKSVSMLRTIAKDYGFAEQPISIDSRKKGCIAIFGKSYELDSKRNIHRYVTITASKNADGHIAVSISEAFAFSESSFAKTVRLSLEKRLRDELPGATITFCE